ncbi:MAG TPA: pantoate--beta-alanine ligase [Bacteroidota bacterium]|nr:pantoate--beta-alanine ligase [Bacteroidota bacterium]
MAARIIETVPEMQNSSERLRLEKKTLALVPTMGSLHRGHAALIERARALADVVVVSIFVNPTQFAPNEDYARYPRDLAHDTTIAEAAGADIIFHPAATEMYSPAASTYVTVEEVSKLFEGEFRPIHFRGVATVVAKLFNIVKPHVAVFGQKDAQQAFIIQKMVRELNFDVRLEIVPIVREADGLAMSSRNAYLSNDERKRALVLSQSLMKASEKISAGERDLERLRMELQKSIQSGQPTGIDYVAFIDPQTFQPTAVFPAQGLLIALAVRFGATRLIDNILIL